MRENKPVGAGLFVRFRVEAESPADFRARYARHVSQGGISLVGATELPVETRIRFTVELKSGQAALTGRGVVRWCAPAEERGAKRWRIGLKFTELDAPSRGLIATMVAGGGPALESLEPPAPEELSLLVDSWGDAVGGLAGSAASLPLIAPPIAPAPPRLDPAPRVSPGPGPQAVRADALREPPAIELFPEDMDGPNAGGLEAEALESLTTEEDDWSNLIRPEDLEPLEAPSRRMTEAPAVRSIAPRIPPATGGELPRVRVKPGVPVVAPVAAPVAPFPAPVELVAAPVAPVTAPIIPPTVAPVASAAPAPAAAVAPLAPRAVTPDPAPTRSRAAGEIIPASPEVPPAAAFPSPGSSPSRTPPTPESPVGLSAAETRPALPVPPGPSSLPAPDERAGRLGRALEALHRGDFEAAESELYQAITLEPRSARLRHELGRLYVAWENGDGHESAAEACFARAYELDPKQLSSLVQLGEVQLRRRLYSEARKTFERALRSDADLRSARRGLERVEALVWRQRLPRMAPVGAAAGLVLLAAAWLRPLRPTVITVPAPAIAAAPRVARSSAANAPVTATPPVAVASAQPPTSSLSAGSARTDLPKPAPPQAAPAAEVVASREPAASKEGSEGHRAKPQPSRTRHAGHRSARRPRSKSRETKSSGGELAKLVKQGDSALRSGRVNDALKRFNQAIAENPRFAPAHRGLGSVFVMQGRDSDAKAAYKKYLALAPNAPDAPRIQALLQDM